MSYTSRNPGKAIVSAAVCLLPIKSSWFPRVLSKDCQRRSPVSELKARVSHVRSTAQTGLSREASERSAQSWGRTHSFWPRPGETLTMDLFLVSDKRHHTRALLVEQSDLGKLEGMGSQPKGSGEACLRVAALTAWAMSPGISGSVMPYISQHLDMQEATLALTEAMHIAQQSGDNSALVHSLAMLSHLVDSASLSAAPVLSSGPASRRAEAKHIHVLRLLRK